MNACDACGAPATDDYCPSCGDAMFAVFCNLTERIRRARATGRRAEWERLCAIERDNFDVLATRAPWLVAPWPS